MITAPSIKPQAPGKLQAPMVCTRHDNPTTCEGRARWPRADVAGTKSLKVVLERATKPGASKPHPRPPSPSNGEGAEGEDKRASQPHPRFPLSIGWRGGQGESSKGRTSGTISLLRVAVVAKLTLIVLAE